MNNAEKKAIKVGIDFEIVKGDGNSKNIPIIINNYNRLEYLEKMVSSLEELGYFNIYVIDNASFYKPLLDYYKKKKLRVFRLSENVGYMSIWQTKVGSYFDDDYYVYSDPDIIPDENCPNDFVSKFRSYLELHSDLDKVGFSLRIDDLPDCYKLKEEVQKHESKFWETKKYDGLFDAPIDTTFALYRPKSSGNAAQSAGARTDFPYVARHIPWYIDHSNLSKEERWYLRSKKKVTHWSSHPGNFSAFKKYYLLYKRNRLPIVWKIRSTGKRVLVFLRLMKN